MTEPFNHLVAVLSKNKKHELNPKKLGLSPVKFPIELHVSNNLKKNSLEITLNKYWCGLELPGKQFPVLNFLAPLDLDDVQHKELPDGGKAPGVPGVR